MVQRSQMKELSLPIYLFHEGTNYEAYKLFCPSCEKKGKVNVWTFRVWAPHAKSVSVVGDFNKWDRDVNPMKREGDRDEEVGHCKYRMNTRQLWEAGHQGG